MHFGLKDIKTRELIRTLALNKIFITNGEGCSLGLSKPSRIIQEMGYDETISRNSIHLSFNEQLSDEIIENIVNIIANKYLQIKSFELVSFVFFWSYIMIYINAIHFRSSLKF